MGWMVLREKGTEIIGFERWWGRENGQIRQGLVGEVWEGIGQEIEEDLGVLGFRQLIFKWYEDLFMKGWKNKEYGEKDLK